MRLLLTIIVLLHSLLAIAQTHHVVIHTNLGDIKCVLYDDTPLHRDEFINLARKGHYNGTLFYRSVKNFVIQGGSSDSKYAKPGQHIGYGDASVDIVSEFRKNHFHKAGALCAPRQPDKVNMVKTSDISQFYIVVGQVYPDSVLTLLEKAVNNPIKKRLNQKYWYPYKAKLAQLKAEHNVEEYNKLATEIKDKIAFEYSIADTKEFTDAQRQAYTTIGGTPELDNEYTVFGEVIEGMDIVRKINRLQADENDRPLTDVRINIEVID